jgi:hypothetical protein
MLASLPGMLRFGRNMTMRLNCHSPLISISLLALVYAFPALAQDGDVGTITPERMEGVLQKRPYSPYANRNFPERPLFGDTHLHTAVSFDAGMLGTTLMPADAYRFAKGEQLIASSGQPVRLSRPLDFLVVADHSDNLGLASDLVSGAPTCLPCRRGNAGTI